MKTCLLMSVIVLMALLSGCLGKTEVKNDFSSKAFKREATIPSATYSSTYPKVYFRGTPNKFDLKEMSLVDNYTWRTIVKFDYTETERFKFDIKGDWTLNFGAGNTNDFIATQNGKDIFVKAGVTYEITFNDATKRYSAVSLDEMTWIGGSYNWPLGTTVNPKDDLWINTKAFGKTTKAALYVQYTYNGVTKEAALTENGRDGFYYNWHWLAGKIEHGKVFTYKVYLKDSTGKILLTDDNSAKLYTVKSSYKTNFGKVYFRGTPNKWGTTEMKLVEDYSWKIENIKTETLEPQEFKFDIKGDWSNNYGDNNSDKIADYFGKNIPLEKDKNYTITFNELTKRYEKTLINLIAPIAVAGQDLVTTKEKSLTLDGGKSTTGSGTTLAYNWTILSKVDGSLPTLTEANTKNPIFKADKEGDYKVSLVVNNGIENSAPSVITIKVKFLIYDEDNINLTGKDKVVLSTYPISQMIPLSDGWIIGADSVNNKVYFINAITGVVKNQYQLTDAIASMDFDFDTGMVYVSFKSLKTIAKINILTQEISYILTSNTLNVIKIGKGVIFAYSPNLITMIDMKTEKELSFTRITEHYTACMVIDKLNNNLIIGNTGLSPATLYRYSIDYVNSKVEFKESVWDTFGSNGQELSISPDNKHVAYSCGYGYLGYNIADINANDFKTVYGMFATDSYPSSSCYRKDSKYILTSNRYALKVFNVNTHAFVKTIDGEPYRSCIGQVYFSTGGKIAYNLFENKITAYDVSNLE